MKKTRENQRTLFEVVYQESIVGNNIETLIRELNPTYFAYILHDRDITPTGEIKKPHYHIWCAWDTPIRTSTIKKLCGFNTESNYLPQQCKNRTNALQYMTHELKKCIEEGKTLYKRNEVVHNLETSVFNALMSKNIVEKNDFQIIFDVINDFKIITFECHKLKIKWNEQNGDLIIQQLPRTNLKELAIEEFMHCKTIGFQDFIMCIVERGVLETYNKYYNSVFKGMLAFLK